MSNMTEAERADYYDAHKDDDSLFSHEPVNLAPTKTGRAKTMFSLRISGVELTTISLAAKARGLSVSEFIRRASLAAAAHEDATARAAMIGAAKAKAQELAETLSRL